MVGAMSEIKHTYYTAAELAVIREQGGPPKLGSVKWRPRVVQLVSHGSILIALMDDGTMWGRCLLEDQWTQLRAP